MDSSELVKKIPMATPDFKTLKPKSETVYDKKIQEELEKRMTDCCDGYSPHDYDRYGYKPRPKKTAQDSLAQPESPSTPVSAPEPQDAPQTDKKNSKR